MFPKNSPKTNGDEREREARSGSKRLERFPKRRGAPQPGSETNVILRDVEIVGTVRFKNDVVIDGKIDGEIISEGSVTVGRDAIVNADIRGRNVTIDGCVAGDIHAAERLDLTSDAEVTGNVTAQVLSMQGGAVLIGCSSVGVAARQSASDRKAPSGKFREFRQAG